MVGTIEGRGSALAGLLAAACVGAPPLPPGADEGSSGEQSAATDDPGSGAVTTATSGLATDGGGSDDTTGPAPDTAELLISDGPAYDYGDVAINTSASHTFTVSNPTDVPAAALELELVAPFVLARTDCASTLAPSASCEIQVDAQPMRFGLVGDELLVRYDDGAGPATASRPLTARGSGLTENLLINGGGERGILDATPPEGWEAVTGMSWTVTNAIPAHGGQRCITAGIPGRGTLGEDPSLVQLIDIAALTTEDTGDGLVVHFRGYRRATDPGNDPSSFAIAFTDAREQLLEETALGTSSPLTWTENTSDLIAPPGTRHVAVFLRCELSAGASCNAYFDDLELTVESPPLR